MENFRLFPALYLLPICCHIHIPTYMCVYTYIYTVYMLSIPSTSYKWNHIIFVCVCKFLLYEVPGIFRFLGQRSPGFGREERGVSVWCRQSFGLGRWKCCGDGCWWWLYNIVNALLPQNWILKKWLKWGWLFSCCIDLCIDIFAFYMLHWYIASPI